MGHLLDVCMVELMVTFYKRAYPTHYMTQIWCSQSPYPHSRSLLTHASTGDTQTLKGRSGSLSVGSLGPGVHKVLFEPSEHLWWVWGFILNVILPLLPSCWGFSFALGCGFVFLFFVFFWWDPTFSCWWLFSSELQFWSSQRRRWAHILLLHHFV